MGQCAVVPPTGRPDKEDSDNFLVMHRPDRANRCILDRDEVDRVLLHQNEEMKRQAQKEMMNVSGITENRSTVESSRQSWDDSDSVGFDRNGKSPSQTATSFTYLTNDTDATMLVSNLDRYALKAKLRKAKSVGLQREDSRERDISHAGDSDESASSLKKQRRRRRRRKKRWGKGRRRSHSASSCSTSSSRHSGHSDDSLSHHSQRQVDMAEFVAFDASDDDFHLPDHRGQDQNSSFDDVVPAAGGPLHVGGPSHAGGPYNALVAPCLGGPLMNGAETPQSQVFTNVLNLCMDAKLSDFYRNHYLRLFPDTAIGRSHVASSKIPKKRSESMLPPLETVSSDASSTSRDRPVVDFFAGVPSSPVTLAVDGSAFLDMAVTGSLGMVDRKRGRDSSRSSLSKQQKSPEHYVVLLHRRSGIPLAICALKSLKGSPVVRIYATKQRVYGQRPAATTNDLGIKWSDSLPLYAWAEIVTQGEFPSAVKYAIYLSTGSDGRFEKEPSYRASHASTESPKISVLGRTELEREYKGCATISLGPKDEHDNIRIALSISRGIDPALFICFAAITDEIMEKHMRLQCDLFQKSEVRRHQAQHMDF